VVLGSKENDVHGAFEAWKKLWDRCIHFPKMKWQPKLS
jgi:hypothetical protein